LGVGEERIGRKNIKVRNMKLIGIRINKDTSDSVKKNLSQEWYPFLNDYYFDDNTIASLSNEEFLKRIKEKGVQKCELYTTDKNSPYISVHAIVGKNGSGKSTILEILFRIINNLAKKNIRRNKTDSADLIYADEISASLFYGITENDIDKYYFLICEVKKDSNLGKVELYDESGIVKSEHVKMRKKEQKEYFEKFFYSIIVNYSHYSLNTLEVANLKTDNTKQMETEEGLQLYLYGNKPATEQVYSHWLNGLFHKNDGYLTPIVINPMRTKGNFDVNKERNLSLQRLFGLLVLKPQFLSEYEAQKICVDFKLNSIENKIYDQSGRWKNYQKSKNDDFYNQNYLSALLKVYDCWYEKYIGKQNQINKITYNTISSNNDIISCLNDMTLEETQIQAALLYMAYKTIAIIFKYEGYSFDKGIKNLVNKIIKQKTHITLKIRQCIYHIENRLLKGNYISEDWQEIEIADFDTIKKNVDEIFEQLYPPIYKTDIRLKNNKTNKLVYFKDMSSGERQMLCSISSVLYHLINLQSVGEDMVKYRHINIILDEVEMYYHPEYQRQFIDKLLTLINGLKLDKEKIKSINICVVTHSPFLLSDIVKSNILYLDEGKSINADEFINPFGANINDILKQSFFLNNGFMGECAQKRIKSLLGYLDLPKENDNKEWTEKNAKDFINIIGDYIIRQQLQNLYNDKYGIKDEKDSKIDMLKRENEQLKKQLNEKNTDK
jgi:predicted ATP-binding protein involved in virulence